MKHMIYGLVCTMVLVFILMSALTIQGRTLRHTEAQQALAESVDGALRSMMEGEDSSIENADLFAADLLQALLAQTNSTSDLTVSVLEADVVHGILSVEITERYRHPNGNEGTVCAFRTVIFDREIREEKEKFKVSFYTGDKELYKTYTIPKDGYCSMPVSPEIPGKKFKNWKFLSGGKAEEKTCVSQSAGKVRKVLGTGAGPMAVTGDVSLIAVFE